MDKTQKSPRKRKENQESIQDPLTLIVSSLKVYSVHGGTVTEVGTQTGTGTMGSRLTRGSGRLVNTPGDIGPEGGTG